MVVKKESTVEKNESILIESALRIVEMGLLSNPSSVPFSLYMCWAVNFSAYSESRTKDPQQKAK